MHISPVWTKDKTAQILLGTSVLNLQIQCISLKDNSVQIQFGTTAVYIMHISPVATKDKTVQILLSTFVLKSIHIQCISMKDSAVQIKFGTTAVYIIHIIPVCTQDRTVQIRDRIEGGVTQGLVAERFSKSFLKKYPNRTKTQKISKNANFPIFGAFGAKRWWLTPFQVTSSIDRSPP